MSPAQMKRNLAGMNQNLANLEQQLHIQLFNVFDAIQDDEVKKEIGGSHKSLNYLVKHQL